jgi:hypothetical protein
MLAAVPDGTAAPGVVAIVGKAWRAVTYISMFVAAFFLYATLTMTYTEFWCIDTYAGWGWELLGGLEVIAAAAALTVAWKNTGEDADIRRMTRNVWILLGVSAIFSIIYGAKFNGTWSCNWFGIYDIIFAAIGVLGFFYGHYTAGSSTWTTVAIISGVAFVYATLSMDQVEYFCGAAVNATGTVIRSKTAGHFPLATWETVGFMQLGVGFVMTIYSLNAWHKLRTARATALCIFSFAVATQAAETLIYAEAYWATSGADWFSIFDIVVAIVGVICVLLAALDDVGVITDGHRAAPGAAWEWFKIFSVDTWASFGLAVDALRDRLSTAKTGSTTT